MKVNYFLYTDVVIDKWVASTHFQSVVCLIYALLMSCTDDQFLVKEDKNVIETIAINTSEFTCATVATE